MRVIGLAGGIGSGKSTTAAYIRSLGYPVFNAANAAKSAAIHKGSPCLQKVRECLGPESILPNGELNRPWVSDKVFHNKELLRQFEGILQEQVWNDVQLFLAKHKDDGAKVVFLDLPLMIERGWYKITDSIWLIALPLEMRIQRAILRDNHMAKETVAARCKAQPALEELEKYANVIIDNSGTWEHTQVQILEQLLKLNQHE